MKFPPEIYKALGIEPGESIAGPQLEAIRQVMRSKCKEDLWFLCRFVLGYRDIETELHRKMCQAWQARSVKPFGIWLIPRSHLKTSIWTTGGTIWKLLNDPNRRSLLVSARYENACDLISEIRSVFDTNEMFRWLFPEYCMDLADREVQSRARNNLSRLDVPCSKWVGRREGSIMCTSVGASMVGKHFDDILFDDAVNDVNTATRELRNKGWDWFLNMLQIREDVTSTVHIVGTRWHDDDWYGRILKQEMERRKKQMEEGREVIPLYHIFRLSCYVDGDESRPIWPERFNKDVLDDIKNMLGPYIFSCQYLNDPVPEGNAAFKEEDIKLTDPIYIPENVFNFMAIDLADCDSKDGDYTVISVASFDEVGRMFMREIYRSQSVDILDLTGIIHRMCLRWDIQRVAVESVIFSQTILRHYKHEAARRNWNIPFFPIKRSKQSKRERIMGLQPRVARGDFYVSEDCPYFDEMLEEFVRYPRPTHDDIIDTIADLEQIYYETSPVHEEEKVDPQSYAALAGMLDELSDNRMQAINMGIF